MRPMRLGLQVSENSANFSARETGLGEANSEEAGFTLIVPSFPCASPFEAPAAMAAAVDNEADADTDSRQAEPRHQGDDHQRQRDHLLQLEHQIDIGAQGYPAGELEGEILGGLRPPGQKVEGVDAAKGDAQAGGGKQRL